jgi:predicted nucleic acid-binding protein
MGRGRRSSRTYLGDPGRVTTKPAPRIVAVDSQTLVWGVRRDGTDEQKQRAKWLFDALDAEDAQIIVPSVVVAEYLTPISPEKHDAVIASISGRFLIAPFDVLCASLAAELFQIGKPLREMGAQAPDCRKCLRADTLIIATAKVKGATVLYCGDTRCRKLATRIMTAQDLPDMPNTLFPLKNS